MAVAKKRVRRVANVASNVCHLLISTVAVLCFALSVRPPVRPSVGLSVCLSVCKFYIFSMKITIDRRRHAAEDARHVDVGAPT